MHHASVGRGVWLRRAGALLATALLALPSSVHAEKADRDKPVQIESDRMEYDDARRISTFIGRVILTKGTIVIRSDRMVVREDTEGFQYGRAEGQPASFRQKREALEEFVEGYGLVIDYDGKAETVTLTSQASLRRIEREQVQDEVHGARIIYQSSAEFYTVEGRAPGALGSDRVRMVIQPRRTGSPDAGGSTTTPASGAGSPTSGSPTSGARSAPGGTASAPPALLRPAESLGTTQSGR